MSNVYLIIYIIAWVITLIIYQRKHHKVDAGSVILISYIVFAICSLYVYNTPMVYHEFNELTLFPFIYLFIMLRIALSPVLRFDSNVCTSIIEPHSTSLKMVSWLIIICAILSIPTYVHQIQTGGFMRLLIDSSAGEDMYYESMSMADESGDGITNIPSIIFNAFSDIAIFLFFYYFTLKKRNYFIIFGLAFAIIMTLISPMLGGLRTNTVIEIFTIIVAYFLFRSYYSQRLRRIVEISGIVLMTIIVIPIVAITNSRFDNEEGGAKISALYYAGQANLNFNNYGLDNNGIRYGDRTFNLAKRLVDPSTPINYVERRDKYHYLYMDDNIFYTFIGDFTLDFGPYIAPIIIILFTLFILRRTRPDEDTITFHQLLLIFLVACICMQGGMYLFAYSDTAGLKLVVLFLLYYTFKFTSRIRTPK